MDYRSTKAFDLILSRLGAQEQSQLLDLLGRELAWLRSLAPGPTRAVAVHARVDAAQERFAAHRPELMRQVRCGKGCAHCCRLWVGVTREETALLAERVAAGNARPDPGRLGHQRHWAEPAEFIGKPREQASCVFLGADGACTVYQDRPAICRAVLVASDPELCRGGNLETRITTVLNPYAEALVSAALTLDAEIDPPGPAGRHLATELAGLLAPGSG